MSAPVETELKLALVNADDWRGILAWSGWTELADDRSWQQETLEAQYFDTPEYALRQAGLAYRLRFEKGRWMAVVKGGGSSDGGLHQRSEWEIAVTEPVPSTGYFQDTSIGERLAEVVGEEPLLPLFTTRFERHTLVVRPDEHTLIEVAVDRGAVLTKEGQAPIQEIELELKSGSVEELLLLGARLAEAFPLVFEERSKYYRGLLAAGFPVKTDKKKPLLTETLGAREGAGVLLRRSLHTALREYVKNRERLAEAESLHQVRIKFRRLRAVLSFVKPLLKAEECREFQSSLRLAGQMLGPARELDVLAAQWELVRQNGADLTEEHSWLTRVLGDEREHRMKEVSEAFAETWVTSLFLRLWAWLEERAWLEIGEPQQFGDFCRERLTAWSRSLHAEGKEPDFSDAVKLHELRISAKKLRYVLEALDGVLPEAAGELTERLRRLQDSLGQLRDARLTPALMRGLLADKSSRLLQREGGILMGWQARGAFDRQGKAEKFWRKLRRRLGRYTKKAKPEKPRLRKSEEPPAE